MLKSNNDLQVGALGILVCKSSTSRFTASSVYLGMAQCFCKNSASSIINKIIIFISFFKYSLAAELTKCIVCY